ncbi:MAG: RNA-binding S4 domain-containing protein [Bacteroidales bacterium]|nr:RNA-binding S4 domain-containing protein [Bacteroidales bacterium]
MERGIRIDKWLWAVRIFKTRSLATDACRSGKVKILDQAIKPSHEVKTGELISILLTPVTKTVKVIAPLSNRVSAKLVAGFMEDLTPDSEYQKLKRSNDIDFGFRARGTGRPTKRDRREIEFLKSYPDE